MRLRFFVFYSAPFFHLFCFWLKTRSSQISRGRAAGRGFWKFQEWSFALSGRSRPESSSCAPESSRDEQQGKKKLEFRSRTFRSQRMFWMLGWRFKINTIDFWGARPCSGAGSHGLGTQCHCRLFKTLFCENIRPFWKKERGCYAKIYIQKGWEIWQFHLFRLELEL